MRFGPHLFALLQPGPIFLKSPLTRQLESGSLIALVFLHKLSKSDIDC